MNNTELKIKPWQKTSFRESKQKDKESSEAGRYSQKGQGVKGKDDCCDKEINTVRAFQGQGR